MSLSPGTRVGIYEVVELVGVGGMGEVYRAKDSRLDRTVAIKTLPEAFAADPDRLARFEREARVLAQLNHPHIASIYGLEPGTPVALAMEMAEGETLAHRIATAPLALDEVLTIARQICEALEHAHARAIMHRDLKPANIKIGPRDGEPHVKVLDFGLAKAMASDASSSAAINALSSPTITSPSNLTRAGIVLGTAAYMAPEQARGKQVDQRADIWAFGCVVFEMLAGRRPFDGDETADVLAKVINSEPDWQALPASTPPALGGVLRRCLRKDPHECTHSIADVRIVIEEIIASPAGVIAGSAITRRASRWPAALAGSVVGGAIVAAAILALPSHTTVPTAETPERFAIEAPDGQQFFNSPGNGRANFAVSPDGQSIAAVMISKDTSRRLFLRHLSDTAFRELAGTEGASGVFWAPDGKRLGLVIGAGDVRQLDLSSDGSRRMVSLPGFNGGSWGNHDAMVASVGPGQPLYSWTADGSTAKSLDLLSPDVVNRGFPHWLPDGNSYLFVEGSVGNRWRALLQRHSGQPLEVAAFDSSGGSSATAMIQSARLLLAATEPTGRTVLTAQPFDPATAKTNGDATILVAGLNPAFSASSQTLVYSEAGAIANRFVWVDAKGALVSEATPPLEFVSNFDLSPDNRLLALQLGPGVQLHDLARGVTSSVAAIGGDPIFSPDGREIAYTVATGTSKMGVFVAPISGGAARRLYASERQLYPEHWSRDGEWIVAVERSGNGQLIPVHGGAARPLVTDGSSGIVVDEPKFSPDGHWIAYGLIRKGQFEVFLSPMPPTGEQWQISIAGGGAPRWRDDGHVLYFLQPTGQMMAVDLNLKAGQAPEISKPRSLFETGLLVQLTLDQYAVSKDGTRFLIRRPVDQNPKTASQLQVIVHWPSLLNANTKSPR